MQSNLFRKKIDLQIYMHPGEIPHFRSFRVSKNIMFSLGVLLRTLQIFMVRIDVIIIYVTLDMYSQSESTHFMQNG